MTVEAVRGKRSVDGVEYFEVRDSGALLLYGKKKELIAAFNNTAWDAVQISHNQEKTE